MLPLLTETTTADEKMNTCMDWHHPTYHWRPHIIQESSDSNIKTRHDQHRWWRGDRKILNGKGSLGHYPVPAYDMHINEEISYKKIKATLHLDTMEYVPFYLTGLFKR